MARFQPGICPNPKGRPKGVIHPSTFFKKQLFQNNKPDIEAVFLEVLRQAKKGDLRAARLIFDHCIPKLMNLDEDDIQDMVEEKLKTISREHLEKIQKEIFDAMKTEPVAIEIERDNND